MGDVDFTDLVAEAEQLAADIEGTGELPRIERSLRQVLEASQALWSRVTVTGAQDIQANLLLGTKGVDLPQITQKLQSLSSHKTFEPLDPTPLTDVQGFLRNERENAILQLIESTHNSTFSYVDKIHEIKMFAEWKDHKTNLMNSLLGYSKDIIDIPMGTEKSVLPDTLLRFASVLDQEEMAYAQRLVEFNNSIIQGQATRPNLLEKFMSTAEAFNNQKVLEMWRMLSVMTQIPPQGQGDPLQARSMPVVQEKMIVQALGYLEQRYKEYMNGVVSGNLELAMRGGIPGTYYLVKAFVSIRVRSDVGLEDIAIDGAPLWPMVYFCLRCGDVNAALQCVRMVGSGMEEMISMLEDLKESSNKRLSVRSEMQARSTYRRVVRTSNDPYKRIIYCVLGACDVHEDHPDIARTADDYLWLKLSQVREEDSDSSPDRIHYSLLQSLVLEEYGESHFRAWEAPHTYFQILVLTGQWESALDFLIRVDRYKSHAMHMAIALYQTNLLALPASLSSPLLVIDEADKHPMRRLNLLRLVLLYTRKFESSDPKEALHYFYCLRHLQTCDGVSAFTACVSNLVVETKQYSVILGEVMFNGSRSPGLLDAFQSSEVDIKKIIEDIASTLESKGQHEDAIKLYDLAGVHEKALFLLNNQLSQVVAKRSAETNALRVRLVQLASEVAARYLQPNCKANTFSTFNTLRELANFFDLYHSKQNAKALEALQQVKLIPVTLDDLEDRVSNFRILDDLITRNIPAVLVATMEIYHNLYIQTQSDTTMLEDVGKTQKLAYLRERAKLLINFAGTVPYRMPGDTNSKLVQLEIMMN